MLKGFIKFGSVVQKMCLIFVYWEKFLCTSLRGCDSFAWCLQRFCVAFFLLLRLYIDRRKIVLDISIGFARVLKCHWSILFRVSCYRKRREINQGQQSLFFFDWVVRLQFDLGLQCDFTNIFSSSKLSLGSLTLRIIQVSCSQKKIPRFVFDKLNSCLSKVAFD